MGFILSLVPDSFRSLGPPGATASEWVVTISGTRETIALATSLPLKSIDHLSHSVSACVGSNTSRLSSCLPWRILTIVGDPGTIKTPSPTSTSQTPSPPVTIRTTPAPPPVATTTNVPPPMTPTASTATHSASLSAVSTRQGTPTSSFSSNTATTSSAATIDTLSVSEGSSYTSTVAHGASYVFSTNLLLCTDRVAIVSAVQNTDHLLLPSLPPPIPRPLCIPEL